MDQRMISSYSQALQPWQNFYILTGTVAATLMGLLFVSMSLNPGIMKASGQYHLRAWAGLTMMNLIALLLLSLTCMLPDLDVPAFSLALLFIGLQGTIRGIRRILFATSDPSESWDLPHIAVRFMMPLVSYLIMMYVGAEVMRGNSHAVDHLVWAVFLLVIGGAGAAWNLLSELGVERSAGQ
ncbi:MAG: hypothetical protein ACKOWF_07895 [Chloroflexota bacterium]